MSALTEDQVAEIQKMLSLTLGQVRTEFSPDEDVFRMFSRPVYWGELLGVRPCFLVGGRGTGKTTTLRSLSYTGQHRLSGDDLSAWVATGAYWRVESNVVTAFRGKRLDDEQWQPIFAHYLNLQLVKSVLSFIDWRRQQLGLDVEPSPRSLKLICLSLNMDPVSEFAELSDEVSYSLAALEAALNGRPSKLLDMPLSALGKPVQYLLRAIREDDALRDLIFTFCIDEFENLEPYQQRVLNTLVKHVGDSPYTFKIGVRDSGRRERATLAADQPLQDPADYTIVDIVAHLKDQSFTDFAAQICAKRLGQLPPKFHSLNEMEILLPGISLEDEAKLLGVDKRLRATRGSLVELGADEADLRYFDAMSKLSAYLVEYWAGSKGKDPLSILRDAISHPEEWKIRLGNYSYVMLFTLRKDGGVRKYYAGWPTLTQLADGNIRYVLRLLYESLILHTGTMRALDESVSLEIQTKAASRVGEKTVRDLQGLSPRGGQLTRLTLGFGRIFGVMASDPFGHTPEVNQFRVNRMDLVTGSAEIEDLLAEAIAYGSVVAFDGDKKARVSGETNNFDYQLHPIFSAYFEFSHRRKRRMTVSASDVLGLSSENAGRTISRLLRDRGGPDRASELPNQLALYGEFFDVKD